MVILLIWKSHDNRYGLWDTKMLGWTAILLKRNKIRRKKNNTVYPKKYAHGFCFAVHCCGYTLTGFPISIRLTSLALWQSNDCPSASKATLMNMDKYFMWIHYERLHNHNKTKHNKTVCIFLGMYCMVLMEYSGVCRSTFLIHVIHLAIFFQVASLELRQSYECMVPVK